MNKKTDSFGHPTLIKVPNKGTTITYSNPKIENNDFCCPITPGVTYGPTFIAEDWLYLRDVVGQFFCFIMLNRSYTYILLQKSRSSWMKNMVNQMTISNWMV